MQQCVMYAAEEYIPYAIDTMLSEKIALLLMNMIVHGREDEHGLRISSFAWFINDNSHYTYGYG